MATNSIAIIGSFRQHNPQIQLVCRTLRTAGFVVTSPQGTDILEEGIEFVRFSSDNSNLSDPEVQSLAIHRIFRADIVYVVAPNGYIGRTTCYEIGRIIQSKKPIYFSEHLRDLPIHVPIECVMELTELIESLNDPLWRPTWLFESNNETSGILERQLIENRLLND